MMASQSVPKRLSRVVHGDGIHILAWMARSVLHGKAEYDLFKLLKKKVFFSMEEMKCLMYQVFEGRRRCFTETSRVRERSEIE